MAEFIEQRGNIFTTQADAVVVTVNCRGVMGAGIALDAKYRWPQMFLEYAAACEAAELRPGGLWWWTDPVTAQRVLCFATKGEWRLPSRIEWIISGLDRLAATYGDEGITSIALPRLGASHGGLAWDAVRPVIFDRLGSCEKLVVELWDFDPAGVDPWFERLVSMVAGADAETAAKTLGMTSRQFGALSSALTSPRVTGLATLIEANGMGERTIAKVYDFLFRQPPPADHHEPGRLF